MNSLVAFPIAAAMPTTTPAMLPDAAPDAVYAAIERHKALSAAYDTAVNHPDVGDHDPQFAEVNATSNRAMRELFECADALFEFRPSTTGGVAALLRYISGLKEWEVAGPFFGETKHIECLQKLCVGLASSLDHAGDARGAAIWPANVLSTPQAKRLPHPDAELLALADDYVATYQKYCRWERAVTNMEDEQIGKQPQPPKALTWRQDIDHQLPKRIASTSMSDRAWCIGDDVNRLRSTDWNATSVAHETLRARAEEIINAFNGWKIICDKKPRGYQKAVRERKKAAAAFELLEDQITGTTAKTFVGMRAKIRCAQAYAEKDVIDGFEPDGSGEAMAVSIFNDLLRWPDQPTA